MFAAMLGWLLRDTEVDAALKENDRKASGWGKVKQHRLEDTARQVHHAQALSAQAAAPVLAGAPVVEILPYLLLASDAFTLKPELLRAYKVGSVLRLDSVPTPAFVETQFRTQGLVYMRIPADDTTDTNLIMEFGKTNIFIDRAHRTAAAATAVRSDPTTPHQAPGPVCVVSCADGLSRSVTVCLAYLVSHGYTLRAALQLVRRAKPGVAPNAGFFEQLREHEYVVHHANTVAADEYALLFGPNAQPGPDEAQDSAPSASVATAETE